jgi:hypothetical protein
MVYRANPVRPTAKNRANVIAFHPGRGRVLPSPAHLKAPEAALWKSIMSGHVFDNDASLELLAVAMEARGRMRKCRERIDKEGESIRDRWGQLKAHPLLLHERAARDSFLKAMRLLNLDLGE